MQSSTQLSAENCAKLLEVNIMPFWMDRMVDEEYGGFYGRIDGTNTLHRKADKSVILNTRILWTFSAVYQKIRKPEYLNLAVRAYEYLTRCFLDADNGGFFWMVNHKGVVKDAKKQVYAQAFALYAMSEFYKVTRDKTVLDLAVSLFNIVEKHSFDPEKNGYLEAFDRNWKLLADFRLSEKDANEVKTMNTHLHVLEAYSNLYSVWPDEELQKQLENLIKLFLDKFVTQHGHFKLFFDEDWTLKSDTFSYGHDIEGGWLLLEAARACKNEELIKACETTAVSLTNAALKGMDQDGGLMNEGNLYGVDDTDKHWWPQAEALVGLINAWEVTGDKSYFEHAQKTWVFITENLLDKEGEWHWMVSRDGKIKRKEDKAGPWKCPYHNGRAMLELIERLGKTNK